MIVEISVILSSNIVYYQVIPNDNHNHVILSSINYLLSNDYLYTIIYHHNHR